MPVVAEERGQKVYHHYVVYYPFIECETIGFRSASPLRQDARPGGRQPIGADAELTHQSDVLGPAVIMIAGDIARVLAEDVAGLGAESVPDRRPAAILPDLALDLVSRGRRAPEKPAGEVFRHDAPPVPARSIGPSRWKAAAPPSNIAPPILSHN